MSSKWYFILCNPTDPVVCQEMTGGGEQETKHNIKREKHSITVIPNIFQKDRVPHI